MDKRLKIGVDLYLELKEAVERFLSDNPDYNLDTANKLGWSQIRYRWELFHRVNNRENNFKFSRGAYSGLTDKHIDSALKKITNTGGVLK